MSAEMSVTHTSLLNVFWDKDVFVNKYNLNETPMVKMFEWNWGLMDRTEEEEKYVYITIIVFGKSAMHLNNLVPQLPIIIYFP